MCPDILVSSDPFLEWCLQKQIRVQVEMNFFEYRFTYLTVLYVPGTVIIMYNVCTCTQYIHIYAQSFQFHVIHTILLSTETNSRVSWMNWTCEFMQVPVHKSCLQKQIQVQVELNLSIVEVHVCTCTFTVILLSTKTNSHVSGLN